MTSRLANRKALASLVAVVALLASACGGGETSADSEDSTVEMTVEAASEGSVDLTKVEAQLSEVLDEVAALKSYFKRFWSSWR
jgi:ABC-type enterochelin transport system substrate-binding protein